MAIPALPGSNRNRQHTRYPTKCAVQAQLPHQQKLTNVFDLQRAIGAKNSDRHREIEPRSFFFEIGRREVDGDLGWGNLETGVLDGRAHPVATLAHRRVGQAHGVKMIFHHLDAGEVDLDVDDVSIDAVDRRTEGFKEHRVARV